jgi:tetratricopeptide (TPR) repeat protein
MKEARAWALNGGANDCKRTLDEANELLADSAANGRTDEPPWIYHLVQEDLAAHQGICLTGLGEANPAIEIFDRALPALPAERIRDRAYYLSWAVKAHVDNHGPEQATALARENRAHRHRHRLWRRPQEAAWWVRKASQDPQGRARGAGARRPVALA